jgi:hypothetical protein
MLRTLLLALLSFLAAGCTKKESGPGHTSHHGHDSHVHTAPHGGTLVPLGDHAYNLEVLRDPATGAIAIYVLGGHAESFVRIKAPSLAINIAVGTEMRGLLLKAVANSATGETVGDSAQFEGGADWLK